MYVYGVFIDSYMCSLWTTREEAENVMVDLCKNWGRNAKVKELEVKGKCKSIN